MRHIAGQMCQI